MKIDSPFGKINLVFHRNNHCRLYVNGMESIVVNGVELKFDKDFGLIDGKWCMAGVDCWGNIFSGSGIALRFFDWKRDGCPSQSAYSKVKQWIEAFFLADLNRGVYTVQLNEAEKNHFKRLIADQLAKIDTCKKSIEEFEKQIEENTRHLATLP